MNIRLTTIAVLGFLTMAAVADERRAEDDRAIEAMRASHVKLTGERAIVWVPAEWPAGERNALGERLDGVVAAVESLLGKRFDAGAYRQRHVEFFVVGSDDVPSHVYGGYGHSASSGDGPYVFLAGLDSGEAPHIHETAHIIGGEFGSLLLREGMATYVQFALEPGAMRPLVKFGAHDLQSLDGAVAKLLQKPRTRQLAFRWLGDPARHVAFSSRPERALFYAVSASFVAFLIDRAGIEAVMEAYASADAAQTFGCRTGKAWPTWTEEWLKGFDARAILVSRADEHDHALLSSLHRRP